MHGLDIPIRRPASAGPSGTGRVGGGALIELGAQVEKSAVEATRAERRTSLPTCMIVIDPPPTLVCESDHGMQTLIPSVAAQSRTRRNSWAFTATMIVLSDMSTAPTAGLNTNPWRSSTPAASGIATML